MTREEEIKQIAYNKYASGSSPVLVDLQCKCFSEGARWADKTFLEKACRWLETHVEDFYATNKFSS